MEQVKAPAINPGLVKLGEHVRNIHVVEIPQGISLDSVLDPEYWAHCTRIFKLYARVECRAQDNAWLADLVVAKVEDKGVRMWVVNYADLKAQARELRAALAAPQVSDYDVSFAPAHKWRVVRLSDKEVIHKGEESREAADTWLAEYLKQPA